MSLTVHILIRVMSKAGEKMQINRYHIARGQLPLGAIFLAGVTAGILLMNLGRSILLEGTGLLDEYTLYHMKYMTVDSSALFYYVLHIRMKNVVLLVILATTYLGLPVCIGAAFWYGLSAGAFLAAAVIRYGLKGILLVLTGVFPHYLFYVPAMLILLGWCERLNRKIYFKHGMAEDAEREGRRVGNLWKLLLSMGMLFFGCLLESFINPGLMAGLLKIF